MPDVTIFDDDDAPTMPKMFEERELAPMRAQALRASAFDTTRHAR